MASFSQIFAKRKEGRQKEADGHLVRALALCQQGHGFEPRLDLFVSAGGVMPTVIPIKEWEAAVYTRILRQWGETYCKYSLTAYMSRRF